MEGKINIKNLTTEEINGMKPPLVPGLNSLDLNGVIQYIKEGHAKNIIIMSGAGISCAAGIPDFRTPGTGLYYNLQKYKLPFPEAVFSIDYFINRPEPFFELTKEMLPGKYDPTPAHFLSVILQKKGLLLRSYTQNIDGLEQVAGLPEEYIVEAHGSFMTAHCQECERHYSYEEIKPLFESGEVVHCLSDDCNGLVRPDIVMYGEGLPDRFHEMIEEDFPKADLLIIMGTSLTVQPFCSLVQRVKKTCPRILLNMTEVPEATYQEVLICKDGKLIDGSQYSKYGFLKYNHFTNTRDIIVLGDVQESVFKFIDDMGWTEEFEAMIPPKFQRKIPTTKPKPEQESEIHLPEGVVHADDLKINNNSPKPDEVQSEPEA